LASASPSALQSDAQHSDAHRTDRRRRQYGGDMRAQSVLAAIVVSTATAGTRPPSLAPRLSLGDTLCVVFSRTISFKIDGYADYVRRISGTASFVVLDTTANHLRFDNQYRFDGLLVGREPIEIRDGGRSQCDSTGACTPITDATGLLYNPLQRGEPPAQLHGGATWTAQIVEPWELGPPVDTTIAASTDWARMSPTYCRRRRSVQCASEWGI
jgi:hypothetical protein